MNKKWKLIPLAFAVMAFASGFAANNACVSDCPCPPEPCAQECPCPCEPCECCPPPAMCDQGYDLRDCYKAAYNAPARIDVRCSWDFFVQADFIYWDAREKGLDLGVYEYVEPNTTGEIQNMDFDYKPGFKVGLGLNSEYDDWSVFAQYTYFHNSVSQGVDSSRIANFSSPWVDIVAAEDAKASAKWERDFDILDFQWSRAYYVGKELTFQPFFGTRAYWFKQTYSMDSTGTVNEFTKNAIVAKQRSWAFGARAGIDTRWLLGDGFRIFGNAATDLVYQNFRAKYNKSSTLGTVVTAGDSYKNKVGYIVPNLELALGLGWGTYLDNSNYHFDIAAGYEFKYFWNQNMMRHLVDYINDGDMNDNDAGDLMLHGLTITARFDF